MSWMSEHSEEEKEVQKSIDLANLELKMLNKKESDLYNSGYDYETRQILKKDIRKKWNQLYNKKTRWEERLAELSNLGIGSKAKRKLIKEMGSFAMLKSERTIGSSDYKKAGYSNVLGSYVVITYTKYSNFMRNVRGCGSLAGKISINDIELIEEDDFNKLLDKGSERSTYFMGANEKKVIPINKDIYVKSYKRRK